jgi:ParB family chromosome partitioning protein
MPKESRDALHSQGKTDVYWFDPDKVVLVTDKASALYDERVHNSFKEELVVNMMYAPDGEVSQGVLKACIGRRNPETGKVEIVDGRQRTINCREANRRLKKQGLPLLRLPVWIRRGNDSRQMSAMISANEHATVDQPMTRALKAQRYIDRGHDEKEVAALLGISEATVKNLLRLLDAPAVIKNAINDGKITASAAYQLAREEPAVAKKKLGELLEHAPRAPGNKRSKNAKRAREIVTGKKEPAANSAPAPAPVDRDLAWNTKKVEDRAATLIAAWIEENWTAGNWDGSPDQIPARIRAGEWRKQPKKESEDGEEVEGA